MARTTKPLLYKRLRYLSAGLQRHFAGQTLQFAGKSFVVTDMLALFAKLDTEVAKTQMARAAFRVQVEAERKLRTREVLPTARDLESFLRSHFGLRSEALSEFGLKPRKPGKTSTVSRVAAVAKRAATRKARNTMGKRQRKQAPRGDA